MCDVTNSGSEKKEKKKPFCQRKRACKVRSECEKRNKEISVNEQDAIRGE